MDGRGLEVLASRQRGLYGRGIALSMQVSLLQHQNRGVVTEASRWSHHFIAAQGTIELELSSATGDRYG